MNIKILTDTQLQKPSVKTLKTILYNTNYVSSMFNDLLFEYFERGLPVDTLEFREHNITSSFLYYAVLKGNYDVAEYMLKNGADPNYRAGLNRSTALHRACLHHDERLVKLLLDYDAKPNSKDGGGSTPLIMLVMGPIVDNENTYRINIKYRIIKLLIKHGANPYAGSFGHHNSLDVAVKYYGKDMYNFILDEYNWHRRRNLVLFRSITRKNDPDIQRIRSMNNNIKIPQWAKDVGITL